MSQLPLHRIHEKSGACFAPYGKWELPEHYGDAMLEYRAVRDGVGLADLSYQGKYLLTGADRIAFLQGLTSNDLSKMSENLGIYTTLLTAKGKIVSDFSLFPLSDGLLMEIEWENAEQTNNHLMRYRLRSRVAITVPCWGKLLVSGPASAKVVEQLIGEPLPVMREKSFFERKIGPFSLLCIKQSITGEADFHLYVPLEEMETLWEQLLASGHPFNIQPVGQTALEILRIEAGKPRYGIDIDETIIPIEAGIADEAISYTKGCYPGQEVIARIKTYGHVNKKLCGLIVEEARLPQKGDKILHGEKVIGWITSAAKSPFIGKIIAMGYLRREMSVPGTIVKIESCGHQTKAEVVPLPFYQKNLPGS